MFPVIYPTIRAEVPFIIGINLATMQRVRENYNIQPDYSMDREGVHQQNIFEDIMAG